MKNLPNILNTSLVKWVTIYIIENSIISPQICSIFYITMRIGQIQHQESRTVTMFIRCSNDFNVLAPKIAKTNHSYNLNFSFLIQLLGNIFKSIQYVFHLLLKICNTYCNLYEIKYQVWRQHL